MGPLVEPLIGSGVGGLAYPAKSGRRRREEGQKPEGIPARRRQPTEQPLNFRLEDLRELEIGLVLDVPVRQHAGAVNEPPDRTVFALELFCQLSHRSAVADVHGMVAHLRAGRRDPVEVTADLALGQHSFDLVIEL